jgi:hypothetical protein
MSKNENYFFIKFGKKEHIEQLHNEGIVYMQKIKCHKESPHPAIGDDWEGSFEYYPKGQLFFKTEKQIDIKIDFIDSISFNPTLLHCFVFCVCHWSKKNVGNITIDKTYCKKRLTDYSSFGEYDYCLVINSDVFTKKLQNKLIELGRKFYYKEITYFDEKKIEGKISPFHKRKKFEWQQEYRFLVQGIEQDDDKLIIPIGSLQDYSHILPITTELLLKFDMQMSKT